MNLALGRDALTAFEEAQAAMDRRVARAEQSMRGYYDEDQQQWCGGLYAFVRYYWDVLEPETEFVDGWVVWAICEHLEALAFDEVPSNRILINVFPGAMKSLLTNVFFPAWLWGPCNKPGLRFVTFSYSSSLTERDNDRFGALVTHDKYTALWGDRVQITTKGKVKVVNTAMGWKLASSIGGVGTGERGDYILLDDPHNVKESESENIRATTVRWFRESMSDRLNSLSKGKICVIMQLVHEDDITGTILGLALPYCHLRIPMEYESKYQFNDDGTVKSNAIGWIDPRFDEADPAESDGVLAWPERFPPDAVSDIKIVKGNVAYTRQYQQTPTPRGGSIFEREWWQLWEADDGKFPPMEFVLASLDTAFTENEQNDPSALTIWGIFMHPELQQRRVMLIHSWRKHLKFSGPRIEKGRNETLQAYRLRTQKHWGLIEWVYDTCERFKIDKLMIEAKANGISAQQELQSRYKLETWSIQLTNPEGDKVARAHAVEATFSQMMVYAPSRDWAEEVIDEMAGFPHGRFRDLTDSATQAIKYLRDVGLAQTDAEARMAEREGVMHKPRKRAIYPV